MTDDTTKAPVRRPARAPGRRRSGFSILEIQVAFVLFGIGLAGVGPLVVMQLKLARKVQQGFDSPVSGLQVYDPNQPSQTTFYFVPQTNPWARKFGVAASPAAGSSFTQGIPTGLYTPPPAGYVLSVLPPVEVANGGITLHVERTPQ